MAQTNNIKFIGNLQVFSSPYASLYLNKEANELFVLVRVSKPKDKEKLFVATVVNKRIVSQYMQRTLGLEDFFSGDNYQLVRVDGDAFSYASAIDRESVIGSIGKKNMFDAEFCDDEPELRCFIKTFENTL